MLDVSVVIPTRNRWELLQRGLSTVLAQESVAVEAIVVDDGSDTPAPASELLADARVRLLRNETPRRPAGARNRGVEVAVGTWIAFMDDDDFWSPAKLRLQLEAASHAQADLVYCSAVIVDPDLEALRIEHAPAPAEVRSSIRTHSTIPSSSLIARAELVRAVGGFDERLRMVDDWDMWIRLVESGVVAACPEALVAYIEHPTNIHMVDLEGLREVDHIIRTYATGPGERRRAERSAAKWRARTHLRAGRRRLAAAEYLRVAVAHRDRSLLVAAARALAGPAAIEQTHASLRDDSVQEPPWLSAYKRRASGVPPAGS